MARQLEDLWRYKDVVIPACPLPYLYDVFPRPMIAKDWHALRFNGDSNPMSLSPPGPSYHCPDGERWAWSEQAQSYDHAVGQFNNEQNFYCGRCKAVALACANASWPNEPPMNMEKAKCTCARPSPTSDGMFSCIWHCPPLAFVDFRGKTGHVVFRPLVDLEPPLAYIPELEWHPGMPVNRRQRVKRR